MTARVSFRAVLAVGVLAVAANCSAPGATLPPPTSLDGAELFSMKALGGSPGCVTCHSLSPGNVLVGPSLAAVGERAGSRIAGLDAASYINQSITNPKAHIVDTFDGPEMPENYAEILSDQQIEALVDYLLEAS